MADDLGSAGSGPLSRSATPLPRISDYVRWHAEAAPSAEAAVAGSRRLDYAALHAEVEALSSALIAAGIKKGDRVASLASPGLDFYLSFLAATSVGAIWLGLNPRYQLPELIYALTDAEPVVLLVQTQVGERSYSAEIADLREHLPSLRIIAFAGQPDCPGTEQMSDFLAAGAATTAGELDERRFDVGGRDPCLLVYTSGSTGKPKGALLHHSGIIAFSRGQNAIWPLSVTRVLNYFPINHIGCVVDVTCPTLVNGGCIVFLEQFDPETSLSLIERERISLWGSVPTVFQMQLATPSFRRRDLSSVELIVWEGAAMSASLIRELTSVCPRLATNYGMTETTSAITAVEPTSDLEILSSSVGEAFPGVQVRIAGSGGEVLPPGGTGEIQVKSDNVMLGYWRQPAATAEAFTSDGWFRTGDLGSQQPDGRYRIIGRLKEMYKSGGYNVYPREIEEALEEHPAIIAAAVVGIPDPLWQEVGAAFLIASEQVSEAQIEDYCRGRLANYKIPKRYSFVGELPLLPIGKVDKVELRRRAIADLDASRPLA